MDSYTSYTDRVLQPAPAILGLKLCPFSLGHSMILKSAKSQFIIGSLESLKMLPIKDLIVELVFAVLVCSTSFDDFNSEIHEGTIGKEVNSYAKRITKALGEAKSFNLFGELNKFVSYIKAGTTAPLYEVKEKGDSTVGTNPIEPEQAILSTLMSECGYTRAECLNLPLTETLSAYLLYAYKQGTIEIISKELAELMEMQLKIKRGNQ